MASYTGLRPRPPYSTGKETPPKPASDSSDCHLERYRWRASSSSGSAGMGRRGASQALSWSLNSASFIASTFPRATAVWSLHGASLAGYEGPLGVGHGAGLQQLRD